LASSRQNTLPLNFDPESFAESIEAVVKKLQPFCHPLEADTYVLNVRDQTLLVSRKSQKAYSAALNNQKSCVVSLPEPLGPQRYHKPNPGRIGCEECYCHLTTSYLVG
jgi:hypothetical protein